MSNVAEIRVLEKMQNELDTLYGTIQVPSWPDDLIVRSLRQLGEWCAAETILASALLEPNDTLWDAGAFLGTFSLGVAKEKPTVKIVAIEANAGILPVLSKNLERLSCDVQVVSCGLAAKTGWLTPIGAEAHNHGATRYVYSSEPSNCQLSTSCRTLADLRAEHGNYDMLKLDLEGMELEALRGDFPYLKTAHPVLWAECNESKESVRLLSGLKWLGYDVMYIAFPAFRQSNYNSSAELIYPMAYEAALVAATPTRIGRIVDHARDLLPGEDIICRDVESAYDLKLAMFDTPRWCREEWLSLSRPELIARLARADQDIDLSTFLRELSVN